MVRPPQRSQGVSFRDQLSELIADHSSEVRADEVSRSLQEISRALDTNSVEDEATTPPGLAEPSSQFEHRLNDLVQRHADLADDWARLTRTLSDLADDLEIANADDHTLATDTTYRRTDDGHLLTVVYPAPFLMQRAVETLAEVGGLVIEGRIRIPILSAVRLQITCQGIDRAVELTARVVQQQEDTLSLDVDTAVESAGIEQLMQLARCADSDASHPPDAGGGSDKPDNDAVDTAPPGSPSPNDAPARQTRAYQSDDQSGSNDDHPLPPGSRAPQTPGTTSNPFVENDRPDEPSEQPITPPGMPSPKAAVVRPAHTPSTPDQKELGVGDGDRQTRRGRRLLDALNSLFTRIDRASCLFEVLGLDWTANGANVRNAHRETINLIDDIASLPLSNDERQRLKEIKARVQRAARVLRHSASRREYRASQVNTDEFVTRMEELETRLAARVLRDDDAGTRRICLKLLELDPSHPNARHHKQRLE